MLAEMTFRVFSSSLSQSLIAIRQYCTVRQIIAPFLFDAYEYVTSQPLAAAHPPSIGALVRTRYIMCTKAKRRGLTGLPLAPNACI